MLVSLLGTYIGILLSELVYAICYYFLAGKSGFELKEVRIWCFAYYQYYVEKDVVKASKTLEEAKYQAEHVNRKVFTDAEIWKEIKFIELLQKEMASCF